MMLRVNTPVCSRRACNAQAALCNRPQNLSMDFDTYDKVADNNDSTSAAENLICNAVMIQIPLMGLYIIEILKFVGKKFMRRTYKRSKGWNFQKIFPS